MSIFSVIKTTSFSKTEQQIKDHILKLPEDVLKKNPVELAEACSVSKATVYRFVDRLGLKGYSELKMQVRAGLDDYLRETDTFSYDFPVKENQTHYQIIQNLRETYHRTTDITASLLDYDELRKAAGAMKKAKRITLYTSSANIYFAENFRFQMMEIGIDVNVHSDEYQQRLQASQSGKDDLAIIITFGGRGVVVRSILKAMNRNHTPVILLSSNEFTPQLPQRSYSFTINPYENHYNKVSSFSTRLSILFILDVLYAAYFELDYAENLKKKLAYYDGIREISRHTK